MNAQHTLKGDGTVPGSKALRRKYNGLRRRADAARRAAADAAVEAELRAKYAGLPPLPSLTLGQAIARATGGVVA